MPFTIERNDLSRMDVEAVVITANEGLQINGGVGLSVARVAGLEQLQAACDALQGCPTGHAVVTPGFDLAATYVIHVVGPVWQGGTQDEELLLRQAYDSALARAGELGVESVALPLVSAHTFGFPVRLSFVIAVQACKAFLEDHDVDVHLVLYGEDAMAVGTSLYDNIAAYIDDHYVEKQAARYEAAQSASYAGERPIQAPPLPGRSERSESGSQWERASAGQAPAFESVVENGFGPAVAPGHAPAPGPAAVPGHAPAPGPAPAAGHAPAAENGPAPAAGHAPTAENGLGPAAALGHAPAAASGPAAEPARAASKPKKRRSVLSGMMGLVESAVEKVSELRERDASQSQQGTHILSEESEEDLLQGSFIMSEQLDELREAPRPGVCPHCGSENVGAAYCPMCGYKLSEKELPDAPESYEMASFACEAPAEAPYAQSAAGLDGHTGSFPPVGEAADYGSAAFGGPMADGYAIAWDEVSASEPAPIGVGSDTAPMPFAQPAAVAMAPGDSLASWLDQLDAPFSTTLLALIDARGMTDVEVYKRANMSRQLFSKIRSDASYRPTKKTVLALAIALGLDLPQTADLLRRAGFALSHSSKSDVIVEYFIVNGKHDIFELNEALYAFDQPLL